MSSFAYVFVCVFISALCVQYYRYGAKEKKSTNISQCNFTVTPTPRQLIKPGKRNPSDPEGAPWKPTRGAPGSQRGEPRESKTGSPGEAPKR